MRTAQYRAVRRTKPPRTAVQRTKRKEAANEKAASKKGADESTDSSFLQKAHKFLPRKSRKKGARTSLSPHGGVG